MASRDNPILFVYGSLKRGGRHHAELRGAPFLGEASTAHGYGLEALSEGGEGEYLVLVPRPHGAVSGEVFQVDAELLTLLDEFEGPDYRRALIELAERSEAYGTETERSEAYGTETEPAEFPGGRFALAYVRRTR